MEVLAVLKSEHSTLLSEVYQMDKQLTFLESSGPVKGARVLKDLIDTSRRIGESLLQHTAKEEKVFFPILESRLGKDRELVEVMKREHDELIGSLQALITELERMAKNRDTTRTWNLVSRFQMLKGSLSDHLSKEERVLFWFAELRLSRLDQRKIACGLQGASEASVHLSA